MKICNWKSDEINVLNLLSIFLTQFISPVFYMKSAIPSHAVLPLPGFTAVELQQTISGRQLRSVQRHTRRTPAGEKIHVLPAVSILWKYRCFAITCITRITESPQVIQVARVIRHCRRFGKFSEWLRVNGMFNYCRLGIGYEKNNRG
jgi:hypothetical protein